MKTLRKFIMVSAIPLIGLFLFLAYIIAGQIHIARQAASLRQLCEFAVKTGSLIHELQSERGKSVGFVAGGGDVLHAELKKQRGKTDTAAGEMTDYLSRNKKAIADAELTGAINTVWKNMAGLEGVRQSVDTANFSARQTLDYYSRLNDSLLRIISRIPPLMTKSEFFPSLTAYLNLLYVKENAGLERAALYSLFIKNTSDPWGLRTAQAAATAQDIFVENFLSYASPGQKDYYSRKMRRPFMDEIEKMRGLAFRNAQGPWDVDPSFWFKMATEKIDALKEVGDYIAQELIIYSGSVREKVRSAILNLVAVATAGIMTFIIFLLASGSRLLRRGLIFLGCGLFSGMTVHAAVEYFEFVGLISTDTLIALAPVLVTLGSALVIAAGIYMFHNVTTPLKTALDRIKKFSPRDPNFDIGPGLRGLKNEIGDFARSFHELIENLRETSVSKSYFESILTTSNDIFVSIDENNSIVEWNPAAERIFGWPRREVIGKQLTGIIIPEQYRARHTAGLKHFLVTGESVVLEKTLELSALHRDGHEFPIEITIWCTRVDEKHQFHAFVRDVTQRKAKEDELTNAHKELAEREKALRQTFNDLNNTHDRLKETQNQLVQSEKLASIGHLAAGVAHEINNPVGFINNNMEILEQYIADYAKILKMTDHLKESVIQGDLAEAKTVAEEITKTKKEINLDYIISDTPKLLEHNRKGIGRIQKIVMDLRTFAREDKNEMEHVKIEDVIEGILAIVHSEIKYKAELEKDYGDTPLIECSPRRLGQVFINLIVNALHAIEGTGTIAIKTYTQDGFVCVDVRDTGKGIPPEILNKIFDPFFTTKPVGQGTGLGLSVSYEIVKKHGGDITVRSKAGEGATFTVMLPIQMDYTRQEKEI
ncbi:MAG: nitrate- and nitrite sensing domain-containing protein [Candidatus Omnitrophica bacterium]|nr:nitrate- and nitrite sensing domain-containing protein [Candidatus Omnitrophota bacterium]